MKHFTRINFFIFLLSSSCYTNFKRVIDKASPFSYGLFPSINVTRKVLFFKIINAL